MPAVGYFDFKDDQADRFPQRFYRAISQSGGPIVLGDDAFRDDRILVKPLLGVDLSLLHRLLGTQVLQTFPAIGNLQIVQLPADGIVANLLTVFRQSGLVEYAEPDVQVHALLEPNDFRFGDGSLWNLHNIGQVGGKADADIDAPEGWDVQNAADDVVVAVIDTGVRYTHEDLAANMWVNSGETVGNNLDDDGNGYVDDVHGINAINNSGDPNDDHGHGTHISGIVGAVGNNNVGLVGVAWKVKIMGCKFLDPTGNGFISDAIKCIDYARGHGANIINTSWGSTTFNSAALRDAFDSARQAGIIVTAAAGNAADNSDVNPLYPASYDLDNIVAVAATTRNDELASFSNYGATNVDLAAPGSPIFSCWNGSDSDYRYFDGTSMAAPQVAGVCALVRAKYPGETYSQIINRVLGNTDPLPGLAGKCATGGRLNLQKALGTAPPPPTPTVTVAATDSAAAEAGADTGAFTISRTGSTASALTVNYTLGGTAVNGTDYQSLSGSATIPASVSSATVVVTPIDDAGLEGAETVALTVSADTAYTVGSPGNAAVTIADNDQPPPPETAVSVIVTDDAAAEAGNDTGTFTISRTGGNASALTVNYSLSGTASSGTDYETLPGTVTIPEGSPSATVTVIPVDDTAVEENEAVVLTLTPDARYEIGSPNSATVTIADNDQPPPPDKPTVTVAATDGAATEAGTDTGTFTVTRSGDLASSLTVHFSLGGSAANGIDYQSLTTSVAFPSGTASAIMTVTPIDDIDSEGNETVALTLSPDAAYTVGSPNGATVTIEDNDQPSPHTLRFYLHGNDIPGTAGGLTMNPAPAPSQTLSLDLLNSPSWFGEPPLTGSFQPGATFTLVFPRTLGLGLVVTFRLAATELDGSGEQLLGQTTQVLDLGLGPHRISIPVTTPVSFNNQRLKLTISTAASLNTNLQMGNGTFLEATEFVGTP